MSFTNFIQKHILKKLKNVSVTHNITTTHFHTKISMCFKRKVATMKFVLAYTDISSERTISTFCRSIRETFKNQFEIVILLKDTSFSEKIEEMIESMQLTNVYFTAKKNDLKSYFGLWCHTLNSTQNFHFHSLYRKT